MQIFAKNHLEILLFLKDHNREYTYDQFIRMYERTDVLFLMDRKLIQFTYDDNRIEGGELTGDGQNEVAKYLKSVETENKEDKRWKQTRLIAWISIGISIIAVIVAILT